MKLNKNTVHFYPLLAIMIGLLGCPPSGPDPVVDTGDTGAAISEDDDEDGFTVADGDCDDSNPSVYPGAEELCDGLDSDCDGLLPVDDSDTDQDEDGFSACADDCDDLNGLIHPAAVDALATESIRTVTVTTPTEPARVRTKTRTGLLSQTVTVTIRTLPSTPGPKNSVTARM